MREREEKREAAGSGESNCRWILKKLRKDFLKLESDFHRGLCVHVSMRLYISFLNASIDENRGG